MNDKKLPGLKELIGHTLRKGAQEMMRTLPNQLTMAFKHKVYQRDIDPATGKPFASLYPWLWAAPPSGVGLCGNPDIEVPLIIDILRDSARTLLDPSVLNDLITDLHKGHGAARPRGGDRRSEKARGDQSNRTVGLNGRTLSTRASSLAGRLAESSDPKVKAAYRGFLEGKYKSITAAAEACGLRSRDTILSRLKQYWNKASDEEKELFRQHQQENP